ncbi:MAG: hypothetical protein GY774_30715 [Planctomycetes bacterium]|nr:hypothetical protein [Planctomycetota bacterium]
MKYIALRLFLRCFGFSLLLVILMCSELNAARSETVAGQIPWEPVGLSGGGGMFSPAISPVNTFTRNLKGGYT